MPCAVLRLRMPVLPGAADGRQANVCEPTCSEAISQAMEHAYESSSKRLRTSGIMSLTSTVPHDVSHKVMRYLYPRLIAILAAAAVGRAQCSASAAQTVTRLAGLAEITPRSGWLSAVPPFLAASFLAISLVFTSFCAKRAALGRRLRAGTFQAMIKSQTNRQPTPFGQPGGLHRSSFKLR